MHADTSVKVWAGIDRRELVLELVLVAQTLLIHGLTKTAAQLRIWSVNLTSTFADLVDPANEAAQSKIAKPRRDQGLGLIP